MNNAWPLWALPFWTMGVPLIWAIIELKRIPKHSARSSSVDANSSAYGAPVGAMPRPLGT